MKKTKGPSDLDYIQTNRANWDERVAIHLRDDAGFYRVEAFLNGEDVRPDIDRKEMHEFAGIDVLHLQCHFGLDTLSVARQAKSVVGVDFSPKAITAACDLAKRVGLADRAEFVLSDLYATPMQVNRQFDLVFSTWGTTIWLPDIWRWGEVFAGFVKPGGRAYFADFHPTIAILDEAGGSLVPRYSWRTPSDQPEVFEEDITYTGAHSKLKNKKTVEWIHPVSDHLNALLNQGLQLEYLHEHEVIPCKLFQCLEGVSNPTSGAVYYRMPEGGVQLPLAFSMMLSRPH
jgi:ubiquinone/menaquinone biosynthesis C-methylase UbiE